MAWWIILGIIVFIAHNLMLPVSLKIFFDGNLTVRVRYAFFTATLYPAAEKKEKKKKRKTKKTGGHKAKAETEKEKKKEKKKKKSFSIFEEALREDGPGAVVDMLLTIARLASAALHRINAGLVVDKMTIDITVASDDAAETAISYGKVCAAVYPAAGAVESLLRIRRRHITVTPDFLREKGEVRTNVHMHIAAGRLLWAIIRFMWGFLWKIIWRKEESSPRTRKQDALRKQQKSIN